MKIKMMSLITAIFIYLIIVLNTINVGGYYLMNKGAFYVWNPIRILPILIGYVCYKYGCKYMSLGTKMNEPKYLKEEYRYLLKTVIPILFVCIMIDVLVQETNFDIGWLIGAPRPDGHKTYFLLDLLLGKLDI